MPRIIMSGEEYPIQPEDIDGSRHFFGAFGNRETEISAGWIIRFLQERNQSWKPFKYEDINTFYSKQYTDGFWFNRLVEAEMIPPNLARAFEGYRDTPIPAGGGWVIMDTTGQYYLTDDFITRCYKSSPLNPGIMVP